MIIYSVTINIDNQVREEWLNWMQGTHIPEVMATGCFVDFMLVRVLIEEEMGGTTYNIQYHATTMAAYEDYQENFAPAMQAKHTERYRNQFVAFRTLLETVE